MQAHSPSASRGALLWELVRLFDSGQPKSEAVLSYLAKQEAREGNPHVADDLRVAWKCVLNASLGEGKPWDMAFLSYFGKPHKKALQLWAEQELENQQVLERCAAMVVAANKNAGRALNQTNAIIPENVSGVSATGTERGLSVAGTSHSTHVTPRGPQNLYDSCREALALPPKKPVRGIQPRKKAA
jgi:hypothetical protein